MIQLMQLMLLIATIVCGLLPIRCLAQKNAAKCRGEECMGPAVDRFMENREWNCEQNGATCFDLRPTYINNCPFAAMAHVCRQGFYEALDGTCRPNVPCANQTVLTRNGSRMVLFVCPGCSIDDKPVEGETELGCLDQEANCARDYREVNKLEKRCCKAAKRYICAKGYYRTVDNKCRPNPEPMQDKMVAKPGCRELQFRSCAPNTTAVCVGDFHRGDPVCEVTGQMNEGPEGRKASARSGLDEKEECQYRCMCKPGYGRWLNLGQLAQCISKEQCLGMKPKVCPENEEYVECPHRDDLQCEKFVKFEASTFCHPEEPSGKKCVNAKTNCIGTARCLCKENFVRVRGRCVSTEQCEAHLKRQQLIKERLGQI